MELIATYDLTETNDYTYAKSGLNYIPTDQIEIQEGENIKAIRIFSNSKIFIIEPNKSKTKIPTKLIIDRTNGRLSQADLSEKLQGDFDPPTFYSAFLGIINILDKVFLLMAEEVHKVGRLDDATIYQIAKINYISFESEAELNKSSKIKDINSYKLILNSVFSFGFYFSYDYDLTLSRNKLGYHVPTDSDFLWNNHLFKDIISQKIDKKWLIPLIQGFFGTFTCKINGINLDFYLITRRSNKRAGTRYNARGLDDEGNVANFCETEQILFYNKFCCSHIQIRGSVPAFWQQRGFTAQTKITRSSELTNTAFLKHFSDIVIKRYLRVLCVNLMAKGKPQEQMITEAYESHIKLNNLQDVKYEYFDFHHACKGQRFDMVNPLVKKLQLMIENFRFFAEDTRNNSILMTQKGVVRTNCLDCLDRTNFFMTKVAAIIFSCQMSHLGVELNQVFGEDILGQLDNNNVKENHVFIQNYKNIWADNGDYISKYYTGTGSTHTNITRTGKRDIFGMIDHGMKSLGRFYKQSFEDNFKQEAIDMILGQHTETVNIFAESLDKELKSREREFSTFEELSIFVASWNMSGFNPPSSFELATELFDLDDNPNPDVFVINLQSIVDSNQSYDIEKLCSDWTSLILGNLARVEENENYILLSKKEYCGCLTLIFAQEKYKTRLTKFSFDTIKFGLLGNRGAVILKFFIDDSSFCLINCQLDGGLANSKYRINDLNDIHLKSFQIEGVGKKKEEKIDSLDYRFLVGDLNFSINLSDSEIRNNIEKYELYLKTEQSDLSNEIIEKLFSFDEFALAKKFSDYLIKYKEAKITFLPTSTYESYSTIYKNDVAPCWSDRIMVSANEGGILKQYMYKRKEYMDSAHRPVTAYFVLEVKKTDKYKKEEITKQIYENQKAIIEEANKEEENLKMKGN